MFCLNCGEAIPDESATCPICGADLKSGRNDQTVVVFASQKEMAEFPETKAPKNDLNKQFIGVILAAVCSLIFLSFNYMSVSIKFLYYGSSDTNYTGYYLTKCLHGTARLSGLMVILLIIINIATIITAMIGIKGSLIKKYTLKKIILIEDLLYIISTVVPLFHMTNLLKEFDSSLSSTGIGIGCYLNIAVAVFMIIMYFSAFSKKLHD